jgi:uncharacterized protein (DUF3820 family)
MKLTERKEKQEASLKKKKKTLSEKVQLLRKSWNPLPVKVKEPVYIIETRSNFINCKKRYFNMGKYKGVDVREVPKSYIRWVKDNVKLNDSELQLLKTIK